MLQSWQPRGSTPDELRERAVRLVFESGPIAHVARDLGIHKEALRHWVRQIKADTGRRRLLLTTDERDELKRLRREVVELLRANAILKRIVADRDRLRNCPRSRGAQRHPHPDFGHADQSPRSFKQSSPNPRVDEDAEQDCMGTGFGDRFRVSQGGSRVFGVVRREKN